MTPDPAPVSGHDDQQDLEFKELIAAEESRGEDFAELAGWELPDVHPPAVLRIRTVDFKEQVLGLRARYWILATTSWGSS